MAEHFQRRKLETGIFADRYGVAIYLKSGGRQIQRRFHRNASIETLREARAQLRKEFPVTQRVRRGGDSPEPITRDYVAIHQECYIYAIRDMDYVKIGRTADVPGRFRDLQAFNPRPLELMVSVRSYDNRERMIHQKFDHLRASGEWFRLDDELRDFISMLQSGVDVDALV